MNWIARWNHWKMVKSQNRSTLEPLSPAGIPFGKVQKKTPSLPGVICRPFSKIHVPPFRHRRRRVILICAVGSKRVPTGVYNTTPPVPGISRRSASLPFPGFPSTPPTPPRAAARDRDCASSAAAPGGILHPPYREFPTSATLPFPDFRPSAPTAAPRGRPGPRLCHVFSGRRQRRPNPTRARITGTCRKKTWDFPQLVLFGSTSTVFSNCNFVC